MKKEKSDMKDKNDDMSAAKACEQQSSVLIFKRWKKIEEDFYIADKKKKKLSESEPGVTRNFEEDFDISKVPEIYDNIKYDMIHFPERRSC